MIEALDHACKLGLRRQIAPRHEHRDHVLLAELLAHRLRVGARPNRRVGGAVLVGERDVALTQEGGDDENRHQHHGGNAHMAKNRVDVAKRRHEATVRVLSMSL